MNKRIFLKSSILLLSLFFINFNFISAQSCNCPGNFILNPSFENGITNWTYANGNFSSNTYAAQCGTYAGHFQHITGLGTFHQDITSINIGTSLTLTFYGGVHDNSFNQKFGIQYLNNLGNLISETMVDVDGSLPNMSYYVINSLVPAGTVTVRIQGRTNGNWLKVDQLCLTGTSPCADFTALAQTDLNLVKTRTISNEISCSGAVDRVFYADCLLDNINGGTSGNRKYWKIISGGTFKEYCDGTAYAEMQIQNVDLPTYKFDVTLILSGRTYSAPPGNPHIEGCTGSATSNWYYYTGMKGSFVGKEAMLGGVIAVKGKMAALQLGTNGSLYGVTNNFGASSWLDYNIICQPNTFNFGLSCQFDFNFFLSGGDLTEANASTCGKICVGQSTTLNGYAVAGKPNYTFAWSNGLGTGQSKTISPATTTSYTVTATDANGCTATDVVTVLVYPKPTVDVGVNQTVCAGKCADLKAVASGGTPAYTYEWNNGLGSGPNKNVCPTQTTTYMVTVTDSKGCTATSSVIVFVNPTIDISISKTDPKCGINNGSATANVTGGTSPYSYLWSNGATTQTINNLSSGNYAVTVTDSKNCTATKSVQLTITSGPIVNAGVDQSGCIGSSFNLSSLASGGTPAYTYVWDNGLGNGQNKTVTPNTTTTYTVTATDVNGCSATDQVKVILYPNPSVTINKSDAKCGLANGSATANASGGTTPYTYIWSNGGTGQTISNLTTGNYIVTVTDAKGCKGTATTTISNTNGPSVNAGSDLSGCIGNSFNLNSVALGGTQPYTYAWDNGLGAGQNKSVAPNATTTYTVTVTDANGCTATDQVKVIIYPNPSVSITKTDAKCGLANGFAIANVTGGTSPYTFIWSNGASTQTLSNLSAGNYTVTVTDSKGCTGTASTSINNTNGPSINAGADQSGCIGSTFNLTSLASGGTPTYAYTWDNGLGNGQNKTVSPNVTTTYSVTVTDANGCSAKDQVKIIIYPNPSVSINKVDAKCGLANGSATANPANGTSPYTYLWSNAATSQTINNLSSGNYFVTVTDSKGCTATATTSISNINGPSVNAGIDQTGCLGSTFDLNSIATGGTPAYSYAWNNGLGSGPNKTVTPIASTTYTVTVTDANGCTATDQIKIILNPTPSVSINKTDSKCNLANGSATASTNGGTAPYTYAWTNGASTQTINNLTAGNYVVTVTDSKGCTGIATTTIGNTNGPSVNAGVDQSGCLGSSFNLNAIATGGTPTYTYEWNNGLGNGPNKSVTPIASTTYTVTVTDINGCTATDQIKIIIYPNPSVTINKTDAKCGLANGSAIANATGGTASYTYIWSNGSTTQMISNLSSGTYNVTVTDSKGCTATAMSTINKINGPSVDAGIDQEICSGNNATISAIATGGTANYSYMWDNGLGSGQSKLVSPTSTTTYTVTVTDANSCTATDKVKISVIDCSPKITHEKNLVSVTNIGLNTYTVVYSILVKNTGYQSAYDLKDNALFDDDIATLSASFTTNAPGNFGGSLNGNGPWTLADDQVITANASHLYTLTFNVKIDLSLGSSGNNIYYQCGKALNNKPSANEALFNESQLDYNNDGRIDERDTACADLPYIVHEKILVGQVQTGSRSFEVTYNIIVKNLGGVSDKYTLTDRPEFDNDIIITSANYSSNAMGNGANPGPLNLVGLGPWTLANNQVISGGGVQTYTLRINVSINLEDGVGDNKYSRCGKQNTTYPITGEGLFNESRLDIKSDGSIDQRDTACGDVPYVVHQKSLFGGVTDLGNGNYRVEYKIDVRNIGGRRGTYDLDDAPAFDDDIIILNASYSFASTVFGVFNNTLNGSGPWALARNQNIDVGDNQFYVISINVKLDLSNQGPGNHTLSDCGERLGMPSAGEALFNKSLLSYNNVLVECDTACTSIPVCSMISGRVFFDVNANGIFDYNENGINGLEVYLVDATTGKIISKLLTAVNPATPSDDGFYMFTCIKPGTYYIQFERPGFLASSVVFQGGNSDKDSDIGHENGINTTRIFVLAGGEKYLNVGAGFQNKATVGDYIWLDRNYNGLQDAGEEPVAGVQIKAYSKTTGNMVSEAVSANDGHYMLDGIGQGDYYVKFIPPANLSFTYAHSGVDPVDNDVDGSNGYGTTRVYRIKTGDAMPTIDAGLVYQVLPLEWLGFDGQWNGKYTELNWQTGVEINNDHFEIERRHETESGFKMIGQLKSSPNSAVSQQNYNFNDVNVNQSGIYYYRLKQIDKDGKYTYSKIISIRIHQKSEMDITIYPNPADDFLKVNITLGDETDLEVRVFDQSGKNVLTNPFGGYRKAGNYNEIINTSYLPSGQYNMQIISKNSILNKTFTVNRN